MVERTFCYIGFQGKSPQVPWAHTYMLPAMLHTSWSKLANRPRISFFFFPVLVVFNSTNQTIPKYARQGRITRCSLDIHTNIFSHPFPTLWTKETRTLSTNPFFSLLSSNISGPLHKLVMTWYKIIHAALRGCRLGTGTFRTKQLAQSQAWFFFVADDLAPCGWIMQRFHCFVERLFSCTVKFLTRSLRFLTYSSEKYCTRNTNFRYCMRFPLYSVFRVASSRMQICPV